MKTKACLTTTTCSETVGEHLRTACTRLLLLLVVLALPAAVQAQFNYVTNNGTITITGYYGPGGDVELPSTIDDLPVTSIGNYAFRNYTSLTSVTIPDSLTNIGDYAFQYCSHLASATIGQSVTRIGYSAFGACTSLASVVIPNSVSSIGDWAFRDCAGLTNVTIPNSITRIGKGVFEACSSLTSLRIPCSVTNLGYSAFGGCASLASVTIPSSVTWIGDYAFRACTSMKCIYFQGDAPLVTDLTFYEDYGTIAYYLAGTRGWGPSLGSLSAVLWNAHVETGDACFGVRTNRFGFPVSGTSVPVDLTIVVEACADLASPAWTPLQTNTLNQGWSYFSDPGWTNHPARFYRLRSP